MKINYDKLKTQFNNNAHRCYLICGDEPLLVEEARQWLTSQIMTETTEHIRFYPKESPWQQLPTLCCNGSLLATQQIIDVRLDSTKLKVDIAKIIVECINHLAPQTTLIFSGPRLESNAQKSTWVKAIDADGLIIQVWPLSNKQFPYWLRQRVQYYQLRLTPAASQMIAEFCEGNLYAAEQTLQKLTLFKNDSPIDISDIQQVLTDSSHYDVFAWVDACLAGEQQRQLKIIKQLQGAKLEPTLALWAIARETRLLLGMQNQLATEKNIAGLLKQQRVLAKKQPLYTKLLQTMDLSFWGQLTIAIAAIDGIVKGIVKGNGWLALSNLGSALALRDVRMLDE